MDVLGRIAEQKIMEAIKRGELENLVYQGKPVELENLSNVPEELRMVYKILKNAHILPEELELKKEIVSLQKLVDYCGDVHEQEELKQRINEKMLKFNILMDKRRCTTSVLNRYRQKICFKLGGD